MLKTALALVVNRRAVFFEGSKPLRLQHQPITNTCFGFQILWLGWIIAVMVGINELPDDLSDIAGGGWRSAYPPGCFLLGSG